MQKFLRLTALVTSRASYFVFRISYFVFRISYFVFRTSYFKFRISNFKFQIEQARPAGHAVISTPLTEHPGGFNPCCRGLGSKTRCRARLCLRVIKFQSLLSWIGFKDAGDVAIRKRFRLRFNPCCRGLGSKTGCGDVRPNAKVQFQSLLSWIGFKDFRGQTFRHHDFRVSILVVVDWVQRLAG